MDCACGCGAPVTGKRPGVKYATDACRARASRLRRNGPPGVIQSVRTLKSGKVRYIVHFLPLWSGEANVRKKGDNVRVGSL